MSSNEAPPAASDVTVRSLLMSRSEETPDRVWIRFDDGVAWTYGTACAEGATVASWLADRGVVRGDRVVLMAGNGPNFLRAWFGITLLGAVLVPVNPSLRGTLLAQALDLVDPALKLADADLQSTLDEASGGGTVGLDALPARDAGAVAPVLEPPAEIWDAHSIMMTSGTTGRSKGVVQSHLQVWLGGGSVTWEQGVGESDTLHLDLPLFHAGALNAVVGCLTTGTGIALRRAPNLATFWDDVRASGATMAFCVSSMAEYLSRQPPRATDRDHGIRLMLASPLPADPAAFKNRFGIGHVSTTLGMSEGGVFTGIFPGTALRGASCGVRREGFDLAVVDDHDMPVTPGERGELVVRHRWPWAVSTSYYRNPEATARAWRNGWFHTGDIVSCDADGYYYFHDRSKDTVRRRGENISSVEVEAIVAGHPGVAEAACVGVGDAMGIDADVKVFVVPSGEGVDLRSIFEHCVQEMPVFMLPRYLEIVDALPKTPTARVQKHVLRERPPAADQWDSTDHFDVSRRGVRPRP